MAQTFLQLVNQAMSEIGMPEQTSLFGSVDDQSKQIIALSQREGKEFSGFSHSRGGWTALHKEHTFTTVDGQSSYSLPADFQYFVDRSFWDGSMRWSLVGPITAEEKQLLRYGNTTSGPRIKFYVRGGSLYLVPTPEETGNTIAYDYYSNAWCQSELGTEQQRWTADNDTYLLDEDCFILGLKWRFLRAKGLDYSEEQKTYFDACMTTLARDGGARDLSLARREESILLGFGNIPDSGYGE